MKKHFYTFKLFNSILYLLKYLCTFFIIIIITSYLQLYFNLNDDNSFTICLILSIFCFYILLKLEKKSPVKYLNLKTFKFKYFYLIILLSLSIVLSDLIFLPILEKIFHIQVPNNNGITFYSFLHIAFIAPIYEEILFRGIIFTKLKQNFPTIVAILLQAIIFGLFHGGLILKLLSTTTGIILGIIYNYTNNLTIVILVHSFLNIFLVILNLFAFDINPIFSIFLLLSIFVVFINKFKLLYNKKYS
ncbi:CPBP family intramembrane glutamic endopeptidase [Clostridium tarantellae]|uniref:CPBP family intramembrane metalloprotease n=1 Tax=Clostridium tarantellae TaxID=39493 RepID=A0A6I1MLK9_9CLOT|nr:type II CAAX endopeptidase family protein [Clostridium tarantellae]MPQ43623.1 CPBP family intramembrane metalloprotease [Clostridium tarantellae]